MRRGAVRPTCAIVASAVAWLAACGFDGLGGAPPDDAGSSADASAERSPAIDAGAPDGSTSDAPVDSPSDAGEGGLDYPFVYGHTTTTLYRMEPRTKAFAVVGPLAGCAGMSDIAVDKDGKIVGVGTDLYAIDPATGACTKIADGPQPFTLTFVPAGTLDPTEEVLVAFSGYDYYRVNRTTGVLTRIGIAVLAPYTPSGDVVWVDGKGLFVSVTSATCYDCLLRVSPIDGQIVENLGPIGQAGVYGLGAWAGKLYGFMSDGETCEITIGAGSVTSTIVPNPAKPASWIGGGSSTRAPP